MINKLVQYAIRSIQGGPTTEPLTWNDGILIQFMQFDSKIVGIVQTQTNSFIAVPMFDLKVIE